MERSPLAVKLNQLGYHSKYILLNSVHEVLGWSDDNNQAVTTAQELANVSGATVYIFNNWNDEMFGQCTPKPALPSRMQMNRNNFDPCKVQNRLIAEDLSHEETTRLLGEACQVIHGLRTDLTATVCQLAGSADSTVGMRQHWLIDKVKEKA